MLRTRNVGRHKARLVRCFVNQDWGSSHVQERWLDVEATMVYC
jgi:hypothetical protein